MVTMQVAENSSNGEAFEGCQIRQSIQASHVSKVLHPSFFPLKLSDLRANPFVVRMWKLGFGMLFVLHFFACVYWFIKKYDSRYAVTDLWHVILREETYVCSTSRKRQRYGGL